MLEPWASNLYGQQTTLRMWELKNIKDVFKWIPDYRKESGFHKIDFRVKQFRAKLFNFLVGSSSNNEGARKYDCILGCWIS